jgi:ABC-type phosphonate transport system ATPase subunit
MVEMYSVEVGVGRDAVERLAVVGGTTTSVIKLCAEAMVGKIEISTKRIDD